MAAMSKTFRVVQDPTKEVPTEVVATSIQAIAEGMRKLRSGRLNDAALILLIQHAISPSVRPAAKVIRDVLEGIDNLERSYLKRVL